MFVFVESSAGRMWLNTATIVFVRQDPHDTYIQFVDGRDLRIPEPAELLMQRITGGAGHIPTSGTRQ